MNAVAERDDASRRTSARDRTRRDLERLHRRDAGGRSFFRSLALIGSVGWPIVLLATIGALVGRSADRRFGTGARWTMTLLLLGTALGCVIAYRSTAAAIRGDDP